MTINRLIIRSIKYFKNLNFGVILGLALSTAILIGALVVGDSVRYSLEQIVQQRLGKTSQVITAGERLFSKQLSAGISRQINTPTTALLRSNGFGVIDGGARRINQLAIWGVDSDFGTFGESPEAFQLKDNEAAINEHVAQIAGLKIGDEFQLRINKLNTFPANTPFVSVAENSVSAQVKIVRILKAKDLGNFQLQNSQSAPRNIFLNLDWLNGQMKLQVKANVILVDQKYSGSDLPKILQQNWKVADLNLRIREDSLLNHTELISDRVFVEPSIERFSRDRLPASQLVFSYFVNGFSANSLQTPYSFISSDPGLSGQQINVSKWLADDLKLKLGDKIRISYFQVGPMRQLVEKDTAFIVNEIYVPFGETADRNLMPDIPGLSDAGNCRDWKSGVPIDLKKIRPTDEAYWKQYGGTPKAFVSLETARKLWGNRFGQTTAIRIPGLKSAEFEKVLLAELSPADLGFEIKDAKSLGKSAAAGGVDFGQLFLGLSFFVLFAAVLLTFILFRLFLNNRKSEIGTLSALGFSISAIQRLFLKEASVYVFLGILLGIPFGLAYNYLIINAISTIWVDVVGTTDVHMHISSQSILAGSLIMAFTSLVTIGFVLNRFLKKQIVHLQRKSAAIKLKTGIWSLRIGIIFLLISLLLLVFKGYNKGEINPEYFFISGFGLLPGLILLIDFWFSKLGTVEDHKPFSFQKFSLRRLTAERHRNILIISFLATGVFLVVSTGLNRKDLAVNSGNHASGTGGFSYWIETSIPVLNTPDTPKGREELDLPANAEIVSFQVRKGDDASCLNLNKIVQPEIIAINPMVFDKRSSFSFAGVSEGVDPEHPWLSLDQPLKDGVIPAFADQTVIQWELGKSLGDTLFYTNEEGKVVRLKLIGGLANSVLQGKVIIAEKHFAEAFPTVSGSTLFLIDLPEKESNLDDLKSSWRIFGPEITKTSDRLLAFYSVESTYLNIFLMLGAIALLIGTIGLGILLYRITLEQVPEYALLVSIGYKKSLIIKLVMQERLFLIVLSVLAGIVPAVLSGLPTLTSSLYANLWIWLPIISGLVLLSGLAGSFMAIRIAINQNLVVAIRND
jgi:putative ABC transport system permease protein